MPRNNADFSLGKDPSVSDIKTAYSANKITLEEAHSLAGGDGVHEDNLSTSNPTQDYGMHAEGTPAGKRERSRKSSREVHKNAGLTVHSRKGY
jgi:hypothetical protein